MTTKDNNARLQEYIRNTIEGEKKMEIERRAKAEAATGNAGGAEIPVIIVPHQVSKKSRIAELLRVLQEAEAISMRFDIDDEGDEAAAARNTVDRVMEELGAIVPKDILDVLAALRFMRKVYMTDRSGLELGTEELAFLNLVDGVSEFVRRSAA